MRALTISQLEASAGVGRDTVYYYMRQGLLPPAQKASATRSIYNESHLQLLEEIARLKARGLSLAQIGERLSGRIAEASVDEVDLVARQNEASRDAILQAAARRFARRGYERTKIADICREAGVTVQVLYGHFPSKRHLFLACYRIYFEWMFDQVQPAIEETDDLIIRHAWRAWASYGVRSFSTDLAALARVEAAHPESDLRGPLRELFADILDSSAKEVAAERRPGANPGLLDDELVVHAIEAGLESMQMRASWDDRFTRRDVLRNEVVLWMAVRAVYSGRLDLTREWEAVEDLIGTLAESEPRLPDGTVGERSGR